MSETIRQDSVLRAAARFFVDPRASVRAVLDSRPSEGKLLAFGMFAGLILFIRQSADILTDPALLSDQDELVTGSFISFLFFVPLAYYGVAALGTMIARLFRGQGGWYQGRVAFFWAAFISAPVMLVTGILPLIMPGMPEPLLIAIGQAGVFFFAWAIAQAFAETFAFTRTWAVLIVVASPAIGMLGVYFLSVLL